MIYLTCALYMEASPFLRAFGCTRDSRFTHEQVFTSEEAIVIITGVGPVPAAISLTEVLALLPPKADDLFANVGTCGCPDRSLAIGDSCIINRICEEASGREFFPDLLYLHSFQERSLTTSSRIVTTSSTAGQMLYDMEASGLFQAALPYFTTDRMFFFKTVSDFGENGTHAGPTFVYELMQTSLLSVLETLQQFARSSSRRVLYSETEEAAIHDFCELLYASETMCLELRRLITYYELERGYAIAFIRDFIQTHRIGADMENSIQSKKEGKKYLEAFRNACLS